MAHGKVGVGNSGGKPHYGLREGQIFWEDDRGGSGYARGVLLLGVDDRGDVRPIRTNTAGEVAHDDAQNEILIEIRDLLREINFKLG